MITMKPAAQAVFDSLPEVWTEQDADLGSPLATFLQALTLGFERVWDIARDSDERSGWSRLLDVESATGKELHFIAQVRGVSIPAGIDDASARALIRNSVNMQRGGVQAIIDSAKPFLSGDQRVLVEERFLGDPYTIRIRTYENETVDPVAAALALRDATPAHIKLVYVVVPGLSYGELAAAGGVYSDLASTSGTYGDLRRRQA